MAELTTLARRLRSWCATATRSLLRASPTSSRSPRAMSSCEGRRPLELIRMTPDVLYHEMVGVGAARKLVFSYAGNPGVG